MHLTLNPISIHLRVPGITITLGQMSTEKFANASYLNRLMENNNGITAEDNTYTDSKETVVDIVNYTHAPARQTPSTETQRLQKGTPIPIQNTTIYLSNVVSLDADERAFIPNSATFF